MGFFVMVLSALTVAYSYTAWRLAAPHRPGRRGWAGVALAVLGALALPLLAVWTRHAELDFPGQRLLTWTALLSAGGASILFAMTVARDLLYLTARLGNGGFRLLQAARRDGDAGDPFPVGRRELFLRSSNLAIAGATVGLTGWGVAEARSLARVERVEVPVEGLAPGLDGLTVVQISDLHVGPTVRAPYVRMVVDRVRELEAELIVVTGDLVDGGVTTNGREIAPIADLWAPMGTFFITGNHEYYAGIEGWLPEIERRGLEILINEHRLLERPGHDGRLLLAGVTDRGEGDRLRGHASDPVGALEGAPAADARLMLAHRPWSAVDAEGLGIDLMLCGHTHGGQFFPWNFVVDLFHPHVRGLNRHRDGMWVYVSRGTGYWGPPLRAGVPAEITHLTLRRA